MRRRLNTRLGQAKRKATGFPEKAKGLGPYPNAQAFFKKNTD